MKSFSQDGTNNVFMQSSLQHAIGLQSGGELGKAEQIYRDVLMQDPKQPVALHYLGILLHQHGRHTEAVEHLRMSCALQPDNAAWFNDLGNVLCAMHQYEEASDAYRISLENDPGDHMVWNNLGSSQLQCHDTENAIISFNRSIELAPEFVPPLMHLGNIYAAAGDTMASSSYQCRAFVLPPHEGKSKKMLGISFYFLGRLPEAADIYWQWMEEEPDNPIAAHMYAACSQLGIPERASDGYIEKHFDQYAETFSANLTESLAYRGPELMREALTDIRVIANRQYDVLDIGCGTGLCAPIAAPYARSLTGVDLSGKMLDQARQRGGYHRLVKQEITEYMANHAEKFDLVLAADTLIYFGQLGQLFHAVAGILSPGGYFLFTVEVMDETAIPAEDLQLHPSGRYRHSRRYVTQTLKDAGLTLVSIKDVVLREEIRQPVAGAVLIARHKH